MLRDWVSVFIFCFVALLALYLFVLNDHYVICRVVDKAVKVDKDSSYYLIYTSKGVYANKDEFLRGKFDSSDVYARIQTGKLYRFRLIGVRIPIFSMYENILAVERISQ